LKKSLAYSLEILPLVIFLVAITVTTTNKEFGAVLKLIGIFAAAILIIARTRRTVFFMGLVVLLVYLSVLTVYRNIGISQAIEDGIRYTFPLFFMLYGLSVYNLKKLALLIILVFVGLNDLYQIGSFLLFWISNGWDDFNISRATGFVEFFDYFGFINLIAMVILNHTKTIRLGQKILFVLSSFCIFFVLWSLSLKMVVLQVLYILIFNRRFIFMFIPFIPVALVFQKNLLSAVKLRFDRYILNPASARTESYRVVKDYFMDFILIGRGPGTFGGPASTKYQSNLYTEYKFNWYGEHAMATTDTYYPHLFVELGIIFGLAYLVFCCVIPLLKSKDRTPVFLILIIILINSVFSFGFNSLPYCLFSFFLIFIVTKSKETLQIRFF
jgi:hypothetical protein